MGGKWLVLAGLAVVLAGCSMGQDLSTGDAAVTAFHRQLDAGQFDAITAAAGPEIQAAPGGFAPILALVHTRLGNVKSTTRTGFNDRIDNGNHRLEMAYTTTFERGDGKEEFVFDFVKGKPVLAGYHVTSDALKGNYSAN